MMYKNSLLGSLIFMVCALSHSLTLAYSGGPNPDEFEDWNSAARPATQASPSDAESSEFEDDWESVNGDMPPGFEGVSIQEICAAEAAGTVTGKLSDLGATARAGADLGVKALKGGATEAMIRVAAATFAVGVIMMPDIASSAHDATRQAVGKAASSLWDGVSALAGRVIDALPPPDQNLSPIMWSDS